VTDFGINRRSTLWILLILILGGAIRLLFLFTPSVDSDQALNGLMARHILGGEFPFFFYGQDYCGSIETYFISTVFFLFGISRFTLNLTIVIESLFFIIFIYYLAKLIFDKQTALLSALFSALASYYLIFHSVLARSAYIEIPIIGVLLLIVACKIIYRHEHHYRNYFILGLLCGLGMWTHFLIVFFLPPIFLFLFIKDQRFWWRWSILFFLLGLILGGLPLWVHNTIHPLVTWHYLWDSSGEGESFLTSLMDFFFYRFPEILGLINNETSKYYLPFFSFFLYLTYLGVFLFLFLSRRKNFGGLVKLKINQSSGLDLLLFFLLLVPVIFALSGFASGHTSRHLMPLFVVLPILLAFFVEKIKSFSVSLAFFFLVLHLFSNSYGTIIRLPLISKSQVTQYQEARKDERNLFKFLKEKNIKHVYTPDYWISVRLTFDANEEIIFAQPVGDRYPSHSDLIDRDPRAAFLFQGDTKDFEETLKSFGGSYKKSQVFGYSLYHDFSPPRFQFIELEPTNWKAVSAFNSKDLANIFDRDLITRWSSGKPQEPGVSFQIDLGQVIPDLGRITLLSGKPKDDPRGLRLEISQDGRKWQTVHEAAGFWSDLFWSGPHPFYRPGIGRIDITFSPRAGRFFKLTQLGSDPTYNWSVVECFIYQALPKIETSPLDLTPLISYLKRFNLADIYATPWIQSQLPLDWRAKQRGLALQKENDSLVQTISNPVFVVEKENTSALAHFLTNNYKQPFQDREISGQVVYSFPPSSARYLPIPSTHWRFQTNYYPQEAHLAADGKMSTRWTTGRPQIPGAYFQIDLGHLEKVARVRFLVGKSIGDFPREFSILYSADGQTWTSLNSILSLVSLHWTGETILKGDPNLDFTFPSTSMRYLQIVNSGKDEVYFWSIHEVEIYGLNDHLRSQ
jgi:hypothetical protein